MSTISQGQRETIGVIGQSGSGKTTLLKLLIKRERRVLIWDWRGEYDGDEISTLHALPAAAYYRKSFLVRYRPFQPDLVAEFNDLARFLCRQNDAVGRCADFTFVIDEAALVTRNRNDAGGLSLLLRVTRHQRINLWWASQRPSGLPGSFLSETRQLYAFRLENPFDVRMLKGRFADTDLARIPLLPDRSYLGTGSGSGER